MNSNNIFDDYEIYQSTKDKDINTVLNLDNSFENDDIEESKININFNLTSFDNCNSIILNNPIEEDSIFINPCKEQNICIPPIPNNNLEKKNNLLGRKTKNSGDVGIHNKYSQDNMIRKIKVIIKDAILEHINSHINSIIKNVIKLTVTIKNKEYKVDKLLNIRQNQIKDINVVQNRILLNKQLRYIFSDEIAGRYSNYPKNYNKIIIDKFYEIGIQKITCILDLTLLECIKYFRKEENIINDERYDCLKGLEKKFENLTKELKKQKYEEHYIIHLIELIKNFEEVYNKKNPRAGRILRNESITLKQDEGC
jgi:hypothetical protein